MDDPVAILDSVKACLSHWQINAAAIDVVSHSENIVYKAVTDDGEQYAIRVHRPGYSSLKELNSEQLWTTALQNSGINVPTVCHSETGQYYHGIDVNGVTRYVGIIQWMDGQPLSELLLQHDDSRTLDDNIFTLGKLIAKMHNQATSWQAPEGFIRRHWDVDGLLGETPHWGRFWEAVALTNQQRKLMSVCREFVSRQLQDYGMSPDVYSMIHADLHAGNLMVTENALVLIDFDDAGYGWHLYDLAVAIHGYQERSDFEVLKNTILKGYRSERLLGNNDEELLPVFLLMRSLASIGWVNGRPELNRGNYTSHLVDNVETQARKMGVVLAN